MVMVVICKAELLRCVDDIEVTSDSLTGRGGRSLFVRYIRSIGFYTQLKIFFGSIRRSGKGQSEVCPPLGEKWCTAGFYLELNPNKRE
jgi:hypothetical protein